MTKLEEFRIENDDLIVTAINFGATLTGIYLKKDHQNLLVSFDNLQDYMIIQDPYLNASVGPVVGRIAYGKYSMNNQTYQLSTNQEGNHLHGGQTGISKQFFRGRYLSLSSLEFTLKSRHDEDGFQGEYEYQIIYSLQQNQLVIELKGIPQEKAILNMTNHLYFNLSGDMKESILNSTIQIDTNYKALLHHDGFPDKIVEDDILKTPQKICELTPLNTPYLLEKQGCLHFKHPSHQITIESTAPWVVLYDATAFSDDLILNQKQKGYPSCGLAIEFSDLPNGINLDDESKYVYSVEKPYVQKTIITFK